MSKYKKLNKKNSYKTKILKKIKDKKIHKKKYQQFQTPRPTKKMKKSKS